MLSGRGKKEYAKEAQAAQDEASVTNGAAVSRAGRYEANEDWSGMAT
jgi:hypothetical protein